MSASSRSKQSMRYFHWRTWFLSTLAVIAFSWLAPQSGSSVLSQEGESAPPTAKYISVPLPITDAVDSHVRKIIEQTVAELPNTKPRPVLVLEFRPPANESTRHSEFERSLALARYLISDRLGQVRTVAYLPQSVNGHAVLPVLACEEIIMAPGAELGAAGVAEEVDSSGDKKPIDAIVRRGYSEIAQQSRTIPPAIALGMLDRQLTVLKVQTLDGQRIVLGEELELLKKKTSVNDITTLVREGEMGQFSGTELRSLGFVSHFAASPMELAAALQLPVESLEEDPSHGGAWNAVRIDIHGVINAKSANWILKQLEQKLEDKRVNLLCVVIDSPGGSPEDSIRLANYLANLKPGEIRTVAFISHQAKGDAAFPALACDHLVMKEDATLGGPGEYQMGRKELDNIREPIQEIALAKHRNWSLMLALSDKDLVVRKYRREGRNETRFLSSDELKQQAEPDLWTAGEEIPTDQGLTGRQAEALNLTRFLAADFAEFRQLYQLREELEELRPNWAHILIQNLASPEFAGTLLFIGFFALMIEMMSPGISVAGFASGLCFLLFFWSKHLDGTAGWLEAVLFLAGGFCLVLELFVLPGWGIFGFGGGVMILLSIILASQTFIIPTNSYQFERLPYSMLMVAASAGGAFISIVLMRKYLPDAPILKRLMLAPPEDEALEELNRRESLVQYEHLLGKRGVSTTQLTPSGKAEINDELLDVISEGDLIPIGTPLQVIGVRGNHVLVSAIEQNRSAN